MSDALDVSRREFVILAAGCAAACACGGALGQAVETGTVDVGAVTDYPKEGIYDQYIKSNKLIVYREHGQMYVSTAVCTHRGGKLVVKGDEITCLRHGAMFDASGAVIKGPAERSLERYAVSIDDKNHLIVDKSRTFAEKDWSDPASFVKVK